MIEPNAFHFCRFCIHFIRNGANPYGHYHHPRVRGENRYAFASCLLFEIDLFRSL